MRITTKYFNKSLISFFVSTIVLCSCDSYSKKVIYELKLPNETDIIFSNNIVETDEFNILSYNNMYMGGGVSIGDINNDELPDIFLTANQESNKLFINKGNFVFQDITESSGIAGDNGIKSWTTGTTMVDINSDGFLDIYVCMIDGYKSLKGTNKLYINHPPFYLFFHESGLDDMTVVCALLDLLETYLNHHQYHNQKKQLDVHKNLYPDRIQQHFQ